jgi:hypothetical protein
LGTRLKSASIRGIMAHTINTQDAYTDARAS